MHHRLYIYIYIYKSSAFIRCVYICMVCSYFYTCCCWCSWVFRVWVLVTSRVVCLRSLLCYVCVFLICSFPWFPVLCSAALYCSYTNNNINTIFSCDCRYMSERFLHVNIHVGIAYHRCVTSGALQFLPHNCQYWKYVLHVSCFSKLFLSWNLTMLYPRIIYL
jgi:hypothetical protein